MVYYEVIYFTSKDCINNKKFERKTEATSFARSVSKKSEFRVQIFKSIVDTDTIDSTHIAYYKNGKKVV